MSTAFWLNMLVPNLIGLAVVTFAGIWLLRVARGPAGAALADWIRRRSLDAALETELREEIASLEGRLEFLERSLTTPPGRLPASPSTRQIGAAEPSTRQF